MTDLGQVAERPSCPTVNAPTLKNQPGTRAFGKVVVGGFFTQRLFTFKPNELRFLKEFGPESSVEDAAKKAGIPVAVAEKMLRRKSVREFLQDKFEQIAIQGGWTVERWFSEGDKVWRGQKAVTREQLDIWKEFGARILPKTRSPENGAERPSVTVNIGAGAVDEAYRRQHAINAEIVQAPGL